MFDFCPTVIWLGMLEDRWDPAKMRFVPPTFEPALQVPPLSQEKSRLWVDDYPVI
jgi:hypothetical protein